MTLRLKNAVSTKACSQIIARIAHWMRPCRALRWPCFLIINTLALDEAFVSPRVCWFVLLWYMCHNIRWVGDCPSAGIEPVRREKRYVKQSGSMGQRPSSFCWEWSGVQAKTWKSAKNQVEKCEICRWPRFYDRSSALEISITRPNRFSQMHIHKIKDSTHPRDTKSQSLPKTWSTLRRKTDTRKTFVLFVQRERASAAYVLYSFPTLYIWQMFGRPLRQTIHLKINTWKGTIRNTGSQTFEPWVEEIMKNSSVYLPVRSGSAWPNMAHKKHTVWFLFFCVEPRSQEKSAQGTNTSM